MPPSATEFHELFEHFDPMSSLPAILNRLQIALLKA